jgi:hypothetical protein
MYFRTVYISFQANSQKWVRSTRKSQCSSCALASLTDPVPSYDSFGQPTIHTFTIWYFAPDMVSLLSTAIVLQSLNRSLRLYPGRCDGLPAFVPLFPSIPHCLLLFSILFLVPPLSSFPSHTSSSCCKTRKKKRKKKTRKHQGLVGTIH